MLAAPVALALRIPLVMVRRAGELPNAFTGPPFRDEHGQQQSLCIERGQPLHPTSPMERSMLIREGDQVVVIDASLRTGETLGAMVRLVGQIGGVVREAAVAVEVRRLARQRQRLWRESFGIEEGIPLFGLVTEDALGLRGELPEGYTTNYGQPVATTSGTGSWWPRLAWGFAGVCAGCWLLRRFRPEAMDKAMASGRRLMASAAGLSPAPL